MGVVEKLEIMGIVGGTVLFCIIAFWKKSPENKSTQGGKRKTRKRKLL